MDLHRTFKTIEKFTVDNSPVLLTGAAVAGTLGAVYLAARAGYRVGKDVNAGHYELLMEGLEPEEYDTKALVKTYWREFLPTAVTTLFAIGAVVGSAHVSSRRAAAMAAAYSLSERAFVEYKEKVVEKIGEKKEQAVRDEIAQDRVNNNPEGNREVIITGNGDVLCYDHFSGRYFNSNMETLRQAENEINHQILNDGYASLTDLYYSIGLKPTRISDEVGWNTSRLLKLEFSAVLSENNKPCIAIDFDLHPSRKFSSFAEG